MGAREQHDLEPTAKPGRTKRFAVRAGAAVASLVVGASSFVVWDSWDTGRSEPYNDPKLVQVTESSEPEKIPALSCEDAEGMLVTGSSMGMQISTYMGKNAVKLANKYDLCVVAIEMGTYYTDDTPSHIARDIAQKVSESKPDGEAMKMVFWGESWGTNMIQRVLNDKAIKGADNIDVKGFIIESAPSGVNSVNSLSARLVMEANKRQFKLGKRTLGLIGAGGMVLQYGGRADVADFFNVHLKDAQINNDKTSPRLVGDQGGDIAVNGFPFPVNEGDNEVPVHAFLWEGDVVVNNIVAMEEIGYRLRGGLSTYNIEREDWLPFSHAECWKDDAFRRKCQTPLDIVLSKTVPRPAPVSVSSRPR